MQGDKIITSSMAAFAKESETANVKCSPRMTVAVRNSSPAALPTPSLLSSDAILPSYDSVISNQNFSSPSSRSGTNTTENNSGSRNRQTSSSSTEHNVTTEQEVEITLHHHYDSVDVDDLPMGSAVNAAFDVEEETRAMTTSGTRHMRTY
jgi:hypothetical protein